MATRTYRTSEGAKPPPMAISRNMLQSLASVNLNRQKAGACELGLDSRNLAPAPAQRGGVEPIALQRMEASRDRRVHAAPQIREHQAPRVGNVKSARCCGPPER